MRPTKPPAEQTLVQVNVRLPRWLHRAFKVSCAQRGESMQAGIARLLRRAVRPS